MKKDTLNTVSAPQQKSDEIARNVNPNSSTSKTPTELSGALGKLKASAKGNVAVIGSLIVVLIFGVIWLCSK